MTSFHANFDESLPNESVLFKRDKAMNKLEDWFDPYNPEHMKAYEVLCKTGCCLKEFIASSFEIPLLCIPNIQAKMSQAWLHAMKHGQIIGSAPF